MKRIFLTIGLMLMLSNTSFAGDITASMGMDGRTEGMIIGEITDINDEFITVDVSEVIYGEIDDAIQIKKEGEMPFGYTYLSDKPKIGDYIYTCLTKYSSGRDTAYWDTLSTKDDPYRVCFAMFKVTTLDSKTLKFKTKGHIDGMTQMMMDILKDGGYHERKEIHRQRYEGRDILCGMMYKVVAYYENRDAPLFEDEEDEIYMLMRNEILYDLSNSQAEDFKKMTGDELIDRFNMEKHLEHYRRDYLGRSAYYKRLLIAGRYKELDQEEAEKKAHSDSWNEVGTYAETNNISREEAIEVLIVREGGMPLSEMENVEKKESEKQVTEKTVAEKQMEEKELTEEVIIEAEESKSDLGIIKYIPVVIAFLIGFFALRKITKNK